MRFKQRHESSAEDEGAASGAPWLTPLPQPKAVFALIGDLTPHLTDWYVTVDERVGDVVGLVGYPWPTTDSRGLPVFDDAVATAWVKASALQQRVDDLRLTLTSERPIRIGDTFAVRLGVGAPEPIEESEHKGETESVEPIGQLERWQRVLDVTREARAATKAAVAMVTIGDVEDPARYFTVADTADELASTYPGPGSSAAGPAVANPAV